MTETETRRLIVLAKPPLLGRAKSRLAQGVGVGRAARLARAMLRDTWGAASALCAADPRIDLQLAVSDELETYPLLQPAAQTRSQGPGDLGQRMAQLMAASLSEEGVTHVLLLGTDSPALPHEHLRQAWSLLEQHDLVLGSQADGGFWCLGARAARVAGPPTDRPARDPHWLDGVDWTRDGTAEPVRERARAGGWSLGEAPAFFDIDHARDLPRLHNLLQAEPALAPATLSELERNTDDPLSVVVASLNEGEALDRSLDALAPHGDALDVIVADGGSCDGSPQRAAARPNVSVCLSPPGRGRQLAAGAALSTGSRLLFLHADVRLPPDGLSLLASALDEDGVEAGAFVTRTLPEPGLPNRAGPLLQLADLRSRISRYPYGDQAVFMTRAVYEAVGGFQDMPLLEDYDLSRRLAARRPLHRIKTPVTVSGRRMQSHPLKAALLMRSIPILYRLGVDPRTLARLYRS